MEPPPARVRGNEGGPPCLPEATPPRRRTVPWGRPRHLAWYGEKPLRPRPPAPSRGTPAGGTAPLPRASTAGVKATTPAYGPIQHPVNPENVRGGAYRTGPRPARLPGRPGAAPSATGRASISTTPQRGTLFTWTTPLPGPAVFAEPVSRWLSCTACAARTING